MESKQHCCKANNSVLKVWGIREVLWGGKGVQGYGLPGAILVCYPHHLLLPWETVKRLLQTVVCGFIFPSLQLHNNGKKCRFKILGAGTCGGESRWEIIFWYRKSCKLWLVVLSHLILPNTGSHCEISVFIPTFDRTPPFPSEALLECLNKTTILSVSPR